MLPSIELAPGDIVQLSPDLHNRALAACLMIVTEVKSWGAVGYVPCPGEKGDEYAVRAYYRAQWHEMEATLGRAVWTVPDGK